MINNSIKLPAPSPAALAHSEKLLEKLRAKMAQQKGYISFKHFMELVLYAPGLGYYSAGLQKFGAQGDFVTAPEISPLFSQCLARQCHEVLEKLAEGVILEFGAGSGVMAADLLLELEKMQRLPEQYYILEISGELKQRQQTMLKAKIPHLFERIQWLEALPTKPLKGIILANEVLDAMPVHRFQVNTKGVFEWYVGWEQGQLVWYLGAPSHPNFVKEVVSCLGANEHSAQVENSYDSEINLLLPAWIHSINDCLQQGLILLLDYGFPAREYYHPSRSMGTLMCHYRHFAHPDPLLYPGLQDITAHVDFTAVAEAAAAAQLKVSGFTTQAAFLLGCGLLELAVAMTNDPFAKTTTMQTLISPNEMGELIKVIALTRGLDELKLCGFSVQDQRGRL